MGLPLIREWFVAISIVFPTLSAGVMFAFPAALVPGITGNSSDLNVSKSGAEWVAATYGISGMASFLIVPLIMQGIGRKACNIFVHLSIVIGSITVALSRDIVALIIGRCFQGMSYGGVIVASVLLGEYCHPKRRGMFVIFKMFFVYCGVFLLHGLSFVLTWRQLAWLSVIPSAFSVVATFAWPASPSWLAYKGRFNECVEAFQLLRGNDDESKKEVMKLIVAQQEIQKKLRQNNVLRSLKLAFTCKDFLMPLFIVICLVFLVQSCGLAYLVAYIIQIMLELSKGDKSKAFYYTMGFDVMKITAVMLSLILERCMKRRTMMLSGGAVAVVLLSCVCLTQYLLDSNLLAITWLAPLALIMFNFSCNVAIIPLIILLKGEMFPLEYRGLGLTLLGIIDASMTVVTTKLTPVLLASLKVYGTFLIYLIVIIVCLITLYFMLPETKDKTLQDIESEFMDDSVIRTDDDNLFRMLLDKHGVEVKALDDLKCVNINTDKLHVNQFIRTSSGTHQWRR